MGTITDPRIGVALGGGAARGLTHIPFIEAMDELGLRPAVIAGSSIGALLGAGWAAGLEGRELRGLAYEYLADLRTIISRIWSTRMRLGSAFRLGISMQLDAVEVIESFVPDDLPRQFADMRVPLNIVSSDFRTWHQVVFRHGDVVPAIAASIAIPSIFKPVTIGERVLIDGSVVNPLPLDLAQRGTDLVVAVDVNGDSSDADGEGVPSAVAAWMGAAQIMIHGLIAHSLAAYPPAVYVRPHVAPFGAMQFWRAREIIESTREEKERFKRQLEVAIEDFIAAQRKIV